MRFRPSYYLVGASPLPLDAGYIFLVGSNIFQLMVVQQLVVIFPAQAGIKIAGRNTNNFRYADDTTLMAESKEELRNQRAS